VSELSRIRSVVVDDETVYSLWDATRVLGYRSIAAYGTTFRQVPKEMKTRVPWSLFGEDEPRGRTMTTGVTEGGLKRMVANSKRAAAVNLAIELGLETVCVPTPEAEVIRIIAAALRPIEFVEEHRVGEYTISGFIPGLSIAIERDRLNDPQRDRQAEFWRRILIEDRLGCEFVVFDPEARDFNPGDLVNKILRMDLPEKRKAAS
jgi:hypothetical protein